MKIACLFPGQGSQNVGMGLNFYQQSSKAKEIWQQIDKIAERNLSELSFQGPAEELKRTINTQPTILSASIAAWETYLDSGGPLPQFVAGHSLGEFSALYAAGVLDMQAVVKLVQKRAQLMEACPAGAMAAVLNCKSEKLQDICTAISGESASEKKVVMIANYNTEEQLVISGDPDSVARASAQAKEQGAKVIPLAVGGAFHSPLMADAAEEFAGEINKYEFAEAKFPIVQNVTALAHSNGTIIRNTLQKQMTSSVRWYETIKFLLEQDVKHFVEIGPGKVLAGMVKRISKEAKIYNVEDIASLKNTIDALKACAVG